MEDYKSNSDKARQEQQSEKKVEAVITGAAKTRKKGEMQKFADVFIAEDANNVKSYILMEVIVPAVKKAISDIVTTGIDMILYGEAGRSKKNGTASKVSYRNYYDQGADRVRAGSAGNRRNTPDDIENVHADNGVYSSHRHYSVTIIDSDPDSELVGKVVSIPTCRFERYYASENLNHWNFSLYF